MGLKRAASIFNLLDEDNSGMGDGKEKTKLAKLLVEISWGAKAKGIGIRDVSNSEVVALIDRCDMDDNEQIDMAEFVQLLQDYSTLIKTPFVPPERKGPNKREQQE